MAERDWKEAARQFYDASAELKARPDFFNAFIRAYRHLRERLAPCFPEGAGRRVLDLGCGAGELESALAGSDWQITGIDISEESLGLARRRNPGIEFKNASMTALPFADKAFDGACALSSLEFCGEKLPALHEIRRVLKDGAFFYVEVRSHDFLLYRLPAPLWAFFEKCGLIRPYPAAGFRDLTLAQWQELFNQAGFRLEKQYAALRPWNYGPPLTRIKNSLIAAVRCLCPPDRHYLAAFLLRKAGPL